MIKKEREYNYDLLRVCSMIAVIMIHVSSIWVLGFTDAVKQGVTVKTLINPLASCIYNSISRFAVPCFIMLSGAFILSNNKNKDYKYFYKKSFSKIGIPTLIFSVLYILYRFPLCFMGDVTGISDVINLIKDIIKGAPMYHMWYMYMLIGLYLLSPVVLLFKDSISEKNFCKVSICFLILASISRWTTGTVRMDWDIGQSFEYLGYFMAGYVIRTKVHKSNAKGIALVLAGLLVEAITAYIEYRVQIVKGISEADLEYQIVSPYCPSIVLASILIFVGFTMLRVKSNRVIENLASISFIVYLMHGGVWDFIYMVIRVLKSKDYIWKNMNCVYWIPTAVIIVLIISVILTYLYNRIFNFLMERHKAKLAIG